MLDLEGAESEGGGLTVLRRFSGGTFGPSYVKALEGEGATTTLGPASGADARLADDSASSF